MDNILKIDNVTYHADLIEPANPHGGKMLKLKREFIFADLDLSTFEQRLLFNAMSRFSTEPFLTDPDVINKTMVDGKQDFSKLTQNDYDSHFFCLESRTILLSAFEALKLIGSRNYDSLNVGVEALHNKTITLNKKDDKGASIKERFVMIERSARYSYSDGRPDVFLLTFSQSFMPFVVAFRNYDRLQMSHLCSLKHKYSFRYLQWFAAKLGQKNEATVYMTVEQIRTRLAIEPSQYKQHFVKRVVEAPIQEVSKVMNLNVDIVAERNEKKRGKPIVRFKFTIKRNEECASSDYETTQELLPSDDHNLKDYHIGVSEYDIPFDDDIPY